MKIILVLSILICTSVKAISQESYEELCKKGNEEMNNKNYVKALSFFDAAFKVGCENEIERAWTATIAAICAQQVEDLNKAVMYYNIAIKSNTTEISVYETQLELAKELKDNKTIEEVLIMGREKLEGQYQKFTNKLLYFYYDNKIYDKVLTTAGEILIYDPDNVQIYNVKGSSYLATGNIDEAKKSFQYAHSLDSTNINANIQLGLIYYNQGFAKYDKANTNYGLLKKPSQLDYIYYRKEMEKANVPFKMAIPYLKSANRSKPDADLQKALFFIYTRIGQQEKASEYKIRKN